MISRWLKSDSLRSAMGFAVGGAGFAVGNIILAKIMSPAAFGVIALVLALNQFGLTSGPFGLEVVAVRHRPRVGARLTLLSSGFAVLAGIIAALIAGFYYHLSALVDVLLLSMVVGAATARVCAGLFQGEHRFGMAMTLSQTSNYVLLIAAVLASMLTATSDVFVLACMSIGYLGISAVGWGVARRTMSAARNDIDIGLALREGAAALGIGVGSQILSQFERFAIPKVGSLAMMGTYAVLAAIVASPFRMIQIGTSFSLLPRLRSVETAAAARAVLTRESRTALVVALGSAVAVYLAAPVVFERLLGGKYPINHALIAAGIVVGMIKVVEGFSTTTAMALGSQRTLVAISVLAWLCIGIAAALIVVGARFGLIGIVYAVGVAWMVLVSGGGYLAVRSFRTRFARRDANP